MLEEEGGYAPKELVEMKKTVPGLKQTDRYIDNYDPHNRKISIQTIKQTRFQRTSR